MRKRLFDAMDSGAYPLKTANQNRNGRCAPLRFPPLTP